jgi:hypothetical protein
VLAEARSYWKLTQHRVDTSSTGSDRRNRATNLTASIQIEQLSQMTVRIGSMPAARAATFLFLAFLATTLAYPVAMTAATTMATSEHSVSALGSVAAAAGSQSPTNSAASAAATLAASACRFC